MKCELCGKSTTRRNLLCADCNSRALALGERIYGEAMPPNTIVSPGAARHVEAIARATYKKGSNFVHNRTCSCALCGRGRQADI